MSGRNLDDFSDYLDQEGQPVALDATGKGEKHVLGLAKLVEPRLWNTYRTIAKNYVGEHGDMAGILRRCQSTGIRK